MKINIVFAMKNRDNPTAGPELVEFSGVEAFADLRDVSVSIPELGQEGNISFLQERENVAGHVNNYKTPYSARIWSRRRPVAELRKQLAQFLADAYREAEKRHRQEMERFSTWAEKMEQAAK